MTNIIADVEDVGKIISSVAGEISKVVGSIDTGLLDEFWGLVSGSSSAGSSYIKHQLSKDLSNFDRDLGRLIVQPLLEGTMGINYDTLNSDSDGAVRTLEGAVGFSLMLDTVTEGLDAVLKPILGDRAPEFILDTIRKIPQAVGMEYFLGITLANTFELAVGTPLEEAINEQVMPSRIDIQILRQLLRQRRITTAEADSYRAKLGYRAEDWQLILDLGTQQLSIGDLQTLYEYGEMDDATFTHYLQQQGFADSDIDYLKVIYLQKSETSGGQVYRQVARTAYMENAISTDQFTSILEQANVPAPSIKLELEALQLQKSIGLTKLSVADIHTAYENGDLSEAEIKARLANDGYKASDIDLILQEWGVGKYIIKPTTSAKTIMRYFRSGIINGTTATQALANIGIAPDTVAAMIGSPQGVGSGYIHTLAPNTVLAAYKDGVLGVDDARAKLESLGMSPTDATVSLQIAQTQIANKRLVKGSSKGLSISDIKDAVKFGTANVTWGIRELVLLGYSHDDANLIMATEMANLTGSPPDGWVELT